MNNSETFADRLRDKLARLSPAARRAACFFRDNPEEVLLGSATALAEKTGVSDATVIRTAQALGFSGMDDLRRNLAADLKDGKTPASRLANTLREVGDEPEAALELTLDTHRNSLEHLRRDISLEHFRSAVQQIARAPRVFIFGLGPSSAMATYFEIQLGRFGIDAYSLTQSGLLLADGLQRLRAKDLLIILAYSRVYSELEALLRQADRVGTSKILVSDSLGRVLRGRVDLVLNVARGRAGLFSMHTATLGLIEALLVGLAASRRQQTLASLERLNRSRTELAGSTVELPGG